ncbi:hypothetical protein LOZ53_002379 [Ophidiomyces ophidiicola]|nr:hypothetical protein LOZ55_003328 [Ophidiomyces ophidiicola]KAI1989212.1 hypothetical protein LOZ54_002950 [Ophidiomyces ophidiicola]KAI1992681.1 hypothetical protein LOZ53_002379 [Ophidiomyces ophidiicola]KAI1992947.1 hypothetical protein LOZ51_004261 [Ophidiomyces ophidiicola]
MSSPGGRRKFQEMQQRRLTTRTNLSPSKSRASQLLHNTDYGADEDDDEETLQLKLAAIEARLKLKKLQHQNELRSKPPSSGTDSSHVRGESRDSITSIHSLVKSGVSGNQDGVQVPLSPLRKAATPRDPISPRRVAWGIDKGLKGDQVSLKRPPLSRESSRPGSSSSFTRQHTRGTNHSALVSQSFPTFETPKIKSFSERLRESKAITKAKWDRVQNVARNRRAGFDVNKKELEHFKAAAEKQNPANTSLAVGKPPVPEFSRADIMQSYDRPRSPLRRNNTVSVVTDSRPSSRDTTSLERSNSTSRSNRTENDVHRHGIKAPDPSKFEPFSGLHLSSRILPHSYITRKTESMKRLCIPDLLKTVKAPDFDLPDTDGDYVVFGVIASKSTPREHKEKKPGLENKKDPYDDGLNNQSKYMVLTLTDLKWSLDLFLFSTAFPKYYKMSPGTLIAILNPCIMPPPPDKINTNRFSLTISSSDDTILEIGTAQDIGFCKAVKKDGKTCDAWVDGRKTEFCDFHVDIQLQKTTSKRMEVNSGPGFGRDPRRGRFGGRVGRGHERSEKGLKSEGAVYDRTSGSMYYVAPPVPGHAGSSALGLRSAASLIDADNPFVNGGDSFHRRGESESDRFRKRLADREKERNIAKRLGEFKSVGSEYMRAQQSEQSCSDSQPASSGTSSQYRTGDDLLSARAALGLDKNPKSASNVKLGRIKKRDFASSNGVTSTNVRLSPVKKTRFITAKGIREAGRDSLETSQDAYSDDDLDIVQ